MVKNVLSVLSGLFAGWIIFAIFQWVGHALTLKPTGFDPGGRSFLKELINAMPIYAWLIVIFGYTVGSFVGGLIVGRFAESTTKIFPFTLSIFFMLAWVINVMMIPHPIWAALVVMLVFIPFVLAGHGAGLRVKEKAEYDSLKGDRVRPS